MRRPTRNKKTYHLAPYVGASIDGKLYNACVAALIANRYRIDARSVVFCRDGVHYTPLASKPDAAPRKTKYGAENGVLDNYEIRIAANDLYIRLRPLVRTLLRIAASAITRNSTVFNCATVTADDILDFVLSCRMSDSATWDVLRNAVKLAYPEHLSLYDELGRST